MAIQALILTAVVFVIRPLDEPASVHLIVLTLTGFVAVGMELLISVAVRSEDQATSFIPLAPIPQLLFAGAIVTVENMSSPVAALSNLVFARWAFATTGTSVFL